MSSAGSAPRPSERRSTEWAHDELRRRIISGELAPGSVISQATIAGELGISRTPLREAVRRLQEEGLLLGEPNRRLRVAEASPDDLDQLYAMRIAMESLALTVGVPRMDAGVTDGLAAALERMERSVLDGRLDLVDEPHREFHRLLVAPAGERFERQARVLWDHTVRYRAVYVHADVVDLSRLLLDAHVEHASILEAVRQGDGSLAGARLARHYARTARTAFSAIDAAREPEAIEAALAVAEERVP